MANILSTFGRGLAKVPGVLRDALTEETGGVTNVGPGGEVIDYVAPSRRVRPVVRDAIIGFMAGASTPNVAYGGGTDIMRAGLSGLGAVQDQEDREFRMGMARAEEARRERAMQAQAEFDKARAQEALADAQTRNLRAQQDAAGVWVPGKGGVWVNNRTREVWQPDSGSAQPEDALSVVRAPSGDMTANMDYAKPLEDAMTKQVFPPYGQVVPVTPAVYGKVMEHDAKVNPAPPKPPAPARIDSIGKDGRRITEFVEAKPGTTYTSQGVASIKRPGGAGKPKDPSIDQLTDEVINRGRDKGGAKTFAHIFQNVSEHFADDPRISRYRDDILNNLIARAKLIKGKKRTESIDLEKVPLPGVKAAAPVAASTAAPAPAPSRRSAPKAGDVVDGYVFSGGNPNDPQNWKPAR